MTETRSGRSLASMWLTDTAALLAVGTAVLYLIGWSFNFGFFNDFGIDSSLFGNSVPDTITTAFRVLVAMGAKAFAAFVIVPLVLVGFAAILDIGRSNRFVKIIVGLLQDDPQPLDLPEKIWLATKAMMILVLLFSALALLSSFAVSMGRSAALSVRQGTTKSFLSGEHPHVRVRYTSPADSLSTELVVIKISSEYAAFLESKKVVIIPREQIAAVMYTTQKDLPAVAAPR